MRERLKSSVAVADPRRTGLISTAHGVNEFYSVALPPIIPLLVTDLNITYGQAGLLLSVFFVMYSVFQLPAGILADRIGKKRLLIAGIAGMAGGIALAALAPDYGTLVAAQAGAGICGSTYHPAGMSLISDIETKATEGRAMGVFGFGGMAGTACAPLLVGGLASVYSWRIALLVSAGLGLLVTAAFAVAFREPEKTTRADGAGDERTGTHERTEPEASERTPEYIDRHDGEPTGTDGSAADRTLEDSAADRPSPIGRITGSIEGVLRFRVTMTVLLLALVTTLVSLQIRAITTFSTSFLFESFGQTTAQANAVFFLMLAASSVASIVVGGLADRFDRSGIGATTAAITAGILLVAGVLTLAPGSALAGRTSTGALIVLFAALGFAVYGSTPIKNALISEYADSEFSGSLFGVTQTASAIGSASGPALFGYLATEYGMSLAFPAIGIVSVAIVILFVALGRSLGG